jgi:rRNA maturation protein Nop10
MFNKGTKLYSIFGSKCPKCHGESIYKNPNPFNIARVYDMPERCSKCGTKYKIEPSFFYGAMYVSYGLGVAIAVAAFITSRFIIGTSMITAF